MRKCKEGWHLDDYQGRKGVCSRCILGLGREKMITKIQEELLKFDGYERGIRSEQERTMEILQGLVQEFDRKEELQRFVAVAIKRLRDDDV
jgi:hypothetical protein